MKMKKKANGPRCAKLFISAFLVTLCLISLSTTANADDHSTHSIIGDFFNKVFDVRLTDGSSPIDTSEDREKRRAINDEIFDGTATKTYSLYDRFGGDISFVPYLGETRIETGIFDRFYTKFMENDGEFKLGLEDIKMFFQQPAISNNVIYTGRPNILSTEEINSGFLDPRVFAYSGMNAVGGNASLGNMYLGFSKSVTAFVAFFSSNGLYKLLNDIFASVMDAGLASLIAALAAVLLPLFIVVAVVGLVKSAIHLVRGKMSGRKFALNLASGVISLGLVFSFVASPMALSGIMLDAVTVIDDVLDQSLQLNADEVILSSDLKNVREATLWKTAVFEI